MVANSNLRRLATTISRQPEWILALAVTIPIVWLHFYFLCHAGGFWRDEVNLINLSGRHSLAEMSKDSFPVLMPLLVSGWDAVGLGRADLSLRLLGVLVGLALPAALWLAVWKIRRAPPLLGLVLLALNSTVIMYGDSLRAFGLGSVLILLTAAAAGWFLQNPDWRRAGVLTALAVLSVQALYQNAVFIAAICFGAWAACARRKDWRMAARILVVAAVSASSLLPYWIRIVSLPESAAALRIGFHPLYAYINIDNAAGFPMKQYLWVWGFLALAVVAFGVGSLFVRAQKAGGAPDDPPQSAAPLFGRTTLLMAVAAVAGFFWFAAAPPIHWCFFPLLAVAIVWCDRRFKVRAARVAVDGAAGVSRTQRQSPATEDLPLFAAVTLLVALPGFSGFLWFAALTTEPWYFLPLLALAAAAIELGLPLASRHLRAATFGFAAATLALGVPAAQGDLNWRFTNVDHWARQLTAEAGPGDFIVVSPWYCGISFERYYRGPAAWNTLPPLADHSSHRYDLVKEQMQTPHAIAPVLDRVAATLRAGHRVWFVSTTGIPKSGAPPTADLPPPPLKNTGWADPPYSSAWAGQAAEYLRDHSRRLAQVDSPTGEVAARENLKLFMAEGWQEPPGAPAPQTAAP